MRFRLTLTPQTGQRHTIPVNYQYPLSSWIYRTIHEGNHAFAEFLHSKGFSLGGRSFKLFTFSMLDFPAGSFSIQDDRLHFTADEIGLEISFLAPDAMQHFIGGLFKNQSFRLGDRVSQVVFLVRAIEMLATPLLSNRMAFRTLSPILISQHIEGMRTAAYREPSHPEYVRLFFDHLTGKFAAALQAGLIASPTPPNAMGESMTLRINSSPKTKGIIIKANTPQQTKIIGYLFEFEITAPEVLLQVGYFAGFGEKNSLGLGCCRLFNHYSH